jgi:hypothetical protein
VSPPEFRSSTPHPIRRSAPLTSLYGPNLQQFSTPITSYPRLQDLRSSTNPIGITILHHDDDERYRDIDQHFHGQALCLALAVDQSVLLWRTDVTQAILRGRTHGLQTMYRRGLQTPCHFPTGPFFGRDHAARVPARREIRIPAARAGWRRSRAARRSPAAPDRANCSLP